MSPALLADAVTLVHFGFVLFVAAGGFLVLRWPRLAWLHVPCFVWGALISFAGWICPLTPLENHFRRLAGQEGYETGFVEHYIIPILYPGALTRGIQVGLGVAVLLVNGVIYAHLLSGRLRGQRRPGGPGSEGRISGS